MYKNFLNTTVKKHKNSELKHGDKLTIYGITYRYRVDPVPYTSASLYHFHGLRHPKTTQEKKLLCDADISTYTRGKKKHLPSAYDDLWRSDISDKSWKRQKIKRQYMKHNHPLVQLNQAEQLFCKQKVRGSIPPISPNARIVELVDTLDLGSSILKCAGSSPATGTIYSGVEKWLTHLPHKQSIAGSNPAPATIGRRYKQNYYIAAILLQ